MDYILGDIEHIIILEQFFLEGKTRQYYKDTKKEGKTALTRLQAKDKPQGKPN